MRYASESGSCTSHTSLSTCQESTYIPLMHCPEHWCLLQIEIMWWKTTVQSVLLPMLSPCCQQMKTVCISIVLPNTQRPHLLRSHWALQERMASQGPLPRTIVPYWQVRGELTLHDDLLLCGRRIVVPSSLRKETLDKIHSCHQGIHFIHC